MKVYNTNDGTLDVYLELHEAEEYNLEYILQNAERDNAKTFFEQIINDVGKAGGTLGSGEFTAAFFKIDGYGYKISLKKKSAIKVKPRKRRREERAYFSDDADAVLGFILALYMLPEMIWRRQKCKLYFYGGLYYFVPEKRERIVGHLAQEFGLKTVKLQEISTVLKKAKLISNDAAEEIGGRL